MKHLLIMSGLDPSGGAGIVADITTACDFGVYPQAIVTALTIQNDERYAGHESVVPELICRQLALLPPFHAIKLGMLPSLEQIRVLGNFLHERAWQGPLVWDPVCVSSSGGTLFPKEQLPEVLSLLRPYVSGITPNLPEAEWLLGRALASPDDVIHLYQALALRSGFILVKGGHGQGETLTDWFYDGSTLTPFSHPRLERNMRGIAMRGTGCRLASALACELMNGKSVKEAVAVAIDYVQHYLLTLARKRAS